MHIGRNDPCPCGSGNKFKKCCGKSSVFLGAPEATHATRAQEASRRLTERMLRFAKVRLGENWLESEIHAYAGDDDEPIDDGEFQLALPWAMFHDPIEGHSASLAELFRKGGASQLPTDLSEMLDAELAAWISVWEVRRVVRGVGMDVTDLVTGEERFVHEVSGSSSISLRDAILGRVVDVAGVSILGGVHPNPLEPRNADRAVQMARKLCRVRTRPAKVDRLRDPLVQASLVYAWRTIVKERCERPPPRLTNTDGDPLAFTNDHFDVTVAETAVVLARIAAFAGAEEPQPSETAGETAIVITKPGNSQNKLWDNTIIGRVVIKGKRMRVESNSTQRADMLRASLESHLGELVRHRLRDVTSQAELLRAAQAGTGRQPRSISKQSPEMAAIAKAFREQHMVQWLDEEIPALGGLTPRIAANQSPATRRLLEILLREFENHESRLPTDEQIDLGPVRASLGITE